MIKTGKVEIDETPCTCGKKVKVVRGRVASCGNATCESVAPQTLHKEATDAASCKADE